MTRLSPDEQITMMSLWCLFRSPLMFGGEMRDNDEFTLSLITNRDVLALLTESHGARQVLRNDNFAVWQAEGKGCTYVGFLISPRFPVRWVFRFIGWGYRALSRFMFVGTSRPWPVGSGWQVNCGSMRAGYWRLTRVEGA